MVKVIWLSSKEQLLKIEDNMESYIFWEKFREIFLDVLKNDLVYSSLEKFIAIFEKIFNWDTIWNKEFSVIERILSDKKISNDLSQKISKQDFDDLILLYKNSTFWLKFLSFISENEEENRKILVWKIFIKFLELAKKSIFENSIKVSSEEINDIIIHWKVTSKSLDSEPNFLSQVELDAILIWPSSINDKNLSWPKLESVEEILDLKKLDESCSWLVNIGK